MRYTVTARAEGQMLTAYRYTKPGTNKHKVSVEMKHW